MYISIHAPRVGSDLREYDTSGRNIISIHAPRVGSDMGRDTLNNHINISIHAPRVGSDGKNLSSGLLR